MNFAIIAAGEGSRLAAEGVTVPKPLIPIGGIPLIERLTDMFERNGASSISIIVNAENHRTIDYLKNKHSNIPLHLTIKSTPGSMHSLYELKPFLQGSDFCLTTVDTVFRENEFSAYLEAFRKEKDMDGLMAVTDFADDEKPLYISTDDCLNITGFHDQRPEGSKYVSGGVYCLRPEALNILETAMQSGVVRMRDFQRQLIRSGLKLKAFPFSKIVDVDHATDIAKAEELVSGGSEEH